jgi:peptidoglycan biosynthesis protein MviN/MurJ (putative lipid II flippase)
MLLSAALAALLMLRLGVPGIALGASIASYVNVLLHFRGLSERLGRLFGQRTASNFAIVVGSSALAGGIGVALAALLASQPIWLVAATTLAAFGLVYVGCTALLGHADARALVQRFAHTN